MMDTAVSQWKTGIYGCCEDPPSCCYGMFCCPCQFGDTSRILGSADCFTACAAISFCTPCVLCCAAPGRRGKLRSALGVNGVALPAEPCGDCYVWAIFPCCAPLANCQEARELKMRSIANNADMQNFKAAALNLGGLHSAL